MELSQDQIDMISSSILLADIQKYIDSHPKEYEEFLKSKSSI